MQLRFEPQLENQFMYNTRGWLGKQESTQQQFLDLITAVVATGVQCQRGSISSERDSSVLQLGTHRNILEYRFREQHVPVFSEVIIKCLMQTVSQIPEQVRRRQRLFATCKCVINIISSCRQTCFNCQEIKGKTLKEHISTCQYCFVFFLLLFSAEVCC